MKSSLATVAVVFLFSIFSKAQDLNWITIIDGGSPQYEAVAIGSDNDVYAIGDFYGTPDFDPGTGVFNLTSTTSGTDDVFVQKLDSSGNFVWAVSFGGTEIDQAWEIEVDFDDNVYITGSFRGTADFDPGSGVFNLTTGGGEDAFLVKLDSEGNFQWAKRVGTGEWGVNGVVIETDDDGNVYWCGRFSGTGDFDPGPESVILSATASHPFLIKLTPDGNTVWVRKPFTGGGPYSLQTLDIKHFDGELLLTGRFSDTVDFDPGVTDSIIGAIPGFGDAYLVKLDTSSDFVWARTWGGTNSDYGTSVSVANDGTIYGAGVFREDVDLNPGPDSLIYDAGDNPWVFVSKFLEDGEFEWSSVFGSPTDPEAEIWGPISSVTPDQNLTFIAGYRFEIDMDPGPDTLLLPDIGSADGDICMIEIDSLGQLVCGKAYGSYAITSHADMAMDSDGSIHTVGFFTDSTDFDTDSIAEFILEPSGFGGDVFLLKSRLNCPVFEDTSHQDSTQFIQEISEGFIRLYPNPTSGRVYFSSELNLSGSMISITDLTGRVIQETWLMKEYFELPHIPAIYLVKLTLQTGEERTFRVVRQ